MYLSKTESIVLTFYRLWISTTIMVLALLLSRRRLSWHVLFRAAPAGVLLGVNLTCYVFAFRLTTIADASVIGALQPALVMIVAALMFGELVGVREIFLTVIAIIGVVGVVAGPRVSIGTHATGDLLAVIGTLAFAGYWLVTKSARVQLPTFEFMAGVWITAAIAITPLALISGESLGVVTATSWLWIVALAVVPGFGHLLMTWGHRFVDASVSSVISISNAAVAAVAALVILGQPLSLIQICSGAVAMGAIALVARGRRKPLAAGVDPIGVPD